MITQALKCGLAMRVSVASVDWYIDISAYMPLVSMISMTVIQGANEIIASDWGL